MSGLASPALIAAADISGIIGAMISTKWKLARTVKRTESSRHATVANYFKNSKWIKTKGATDMKRKTEHTKGPWTVMAGAMPNVLAGGLRVARCDFDGAVYPECHANARLIASAPDMEARLSQIAEIIKQIESRCAVGELQVSRFQDEMTGDEVRLIYHLARGKK